MKDQTREIRYFLFSQYFSDGLRITLGVLLPSLLFAYLGQFETGLTISLGALCVSITDTPGPIIHKRNAMLLCNALIFLVAVITGFVNQNQFLLGLEIAAFCFLFSMFMVYGNRAGAVGTAALVVMILTLDTRLEPMEVWKHALLVLDGGIWYMLLSLLFFRIRPYQQARQALGTCMHEVAKFLRLKADFYTISTDLDEDYRNLVTQQIKVNEVQDAVREVLFKSPLLVKESTPTSRQLVLMFVDLIDLFEQIMAIHYDYATLRQKFGNSGILEKIAVMIREMADDLDEVGLAVQAHTQPEKAGSLREKFHDLRNAIDAFGNSQPDQSNIPLKKILVNLRGLGQRLITIRRYAQANETTEFNLNRVITYHKFVAPQKFDVKLIRNNLTWESAIFRHAMRVALVCLFGFVLTQFLTYGHHSYWVLLTIIVILKPGFSLTKQRNYERIVGTIAGGALGILILALVPNRNIQFVFLLLFMIGTYSFQRMNYVVSVIFMTPFVLILFNFLGTGSDNIAQERIIDTLIGAAIAFTASYLLFPRWESQQLRHFMYEMLNANAAYLQKIIDSLAGKTIRTEDYKLARKQVYVSSANLSAAVQRMISEPKHTQKHAKEVQKFVVLNHMLSSYIADMAITQPVTDKQPLSPENLRPVKRAMAVLEECAQKLSPTGIDRKPETQTLLPVPELKTIEASPEENLLKEQLEHIRKVSNDIRKITEIILT